jgi:uncharacterized spore protein YtfJ
MTRRLGPIRRHGPWRIAAVEETRITALPVGPGLAASATKEPLAVLLLGPMGLVALDLAGRRMPPDHLDRLCPDAADRMRRATDPHMTA